MERYRLPSAIYITVYFTNLQCRGKTSVIRGIVKFLTNTDYSVDCVREM